MRSDYQIDLTFVDVDYVMLFVLVRRSPLLQQGLFALVCFGRGFPSETPETSRC